MQTHTHHHRAPPVPPVNAWSVRAWPPLLWQANATARVQFHHLGTRIVTKGDPGFPTAGQTFWAAQAAEGEAGLAWDWIKVTRGVVALADPMSVITNLRLLGQAGEVLTAEEAARFLNVYVRELPWQRQVWQALSELPS